MFDAILLTSTDSNNYKLQHAMKYLFAIVLFAVFVAALANSTVKPAKSDNDAKKAQCNVYNYFYAGPNTKKIEQQLAEIREEIRALKGNLTGGSGGKGL